ncbi:MAG: hypothetical protein V2B18_25380 [Pseudomonadota bacterium]
MTEKAEHKKYTWLSVALALVGTVLGAASATATWSFYAGQKVAAMSKDIEAGANHDLGQDASLARQIETDNKLLECVSLLREQNARVDERLKNIDLRQMQMDTKLDRALQRP